MGQGIDKGGVADACWSLIIDLTLSELVLIRLPLTTAVVDQFHVNRIFFVINDLG